jgi:hypothetical protein
MKKRIIILIIIILLVIAVLIIVGYLKNKKQQKEIGAVETSQEVSFPIPISKEKEISKKQQEETQKQKEKEEEKAYQTLFDQSFIYVDLDYPLLYVYDPKNQVFKYLNLENETYKEIAKISDFKQAWYSEDKTKLIVQTNIGFGLVDLQTDEIWDLPPLTKNFVFTPDVWIYLSDNEELSFLGKFQKGEVEKIRDLGILNPEFALLKNGLLIYEKNSPLFYLDLKNPEELKIFLNDKNYFDVLVSKNKDLIFLVFKENEKFQSKIFDLNKKTQTSFSWATNKEKCSFDEVLVCALSENQDLENWTMMVPSNDTKIIIYNPRNQELKEINLEPGFDFVKPKLTPLGLIAWDRLSAKFYLIPYR